MKVLVLLGSDSTEREVSLRSGAAVIEALAQTAHDVDSYDPVKGSDGLLAAARQADVVLPILHGGAGEDGRLQEHLESIGVRFLGAQSDSSADAMNKHKTHEILAEHGIDMPRFEIVSKSTFADSVLSKKPYVLKRVDGGSSIDIVIARQPSIVNNKKSQKLLNVYESMLLEELVEGQECTVPILDTQPLPPIAIIPPADGEFDYENKYNGVTKEICPIPSTILDAAVLRRMQEIALKVHRALGIRHLSRVDMIVRPDGQVVVLELNTLPGLTEQSLVPKSAAVAGISMVQLVERFVRLAARS